MLVKKTNILLCDDAGEKTNILLCDDAVEKINILLCDDAGENLTGRDTVKNYEFSNNIFICIF
jgi:hypothetical protein